MAATGETYVEVDDAAEVWTVEGAAGEPSAGAAALHALQRLAALKGAVGVVLVTWCG